MYNLANKKSYFRVLALVLMVTTFLPLLTNNLPPVIRSHHPWVILWLFSLLAFAPRTFAHKQFLYVFLFMSFIVLVMANLVWVSIDEWTIRQLRNEYYVFLVAFSLYAYFRVSKDFDGWAWVVKWTIILVGITAIMSIVSSYMDPMYARKLTGGFAEEIEEITRYGGGGYGFAGSLLCLFPMIAYYYRNHTLTPYSRTTILIFGLICLLALFRMNIMANILLAFIIIIFSLLGTRHIRISLPLTITLLSIALIIPRELYSRLFFEAGDLFSQDSFIHSKLNDLALYFHLGGYEGTGAGHRAARYPLLLEAFFKAPFLGYFSNEGVLDIAPGAHIFWMYKLTVFGVLAFVGFLTVFYVYIKNSLKLFDQEFTFYFLLSVFSVIGLGLIKNLAGRELWYMLFFLIPGLYHLSLLQRNHKKTITYSQTLPLYNIDRP